MTYRPKFCVEFPCQDPHCRQSDGVVRYDTHIYDLDPIQITQILEDNVADLTEEQILRSQLQLTECQKEELRATNVVRWPIAFNFTSCSECGEPDKEVSEE